jgi:hypothetical protein
VVILWDILKKVILARCETQEVMSALAWHPGKDENVLAGIREDGRVSLWRNAVPARLPNPAAPLDADALHMEADMPNADESNGAQHHSLAEAYIRRS